MERLTSVGCIPFSSQLFVGSSEQCGSSHQGCFLGGLEAPRWQHQPRAVSDLIPNVAFVVHDGWWCGGGHARRRPWPPQLWGTVGGIGPGVGFGSAPWLRRRRRALPRPNPQEADATIGGTPTPPSGDIVDGEGEGVLDIINDDQLFYLLGLRTDDDQHDRPSDQIFYF